MMPVVATQETADQSVQQAIKALETVLSPLASSSDRAAANQYCEGIKQDVGRSLHLAVTFVPYTNNYPPAIRQFGLNLLEHVVKGLGSSDPLLEQGFLEQLWGLAFGPNGLNGDQGESRTIKEKMAVVIVQAAVRVWPQRWNSLYDLLMAEMGCLAAGPTTARQALNAELAVTIFRMLTEEIHRASDSESGIAWDETRKGELQAALALILPGFAEWLWAVLPIAASRSTPNNPTSMSILTALVLSFGSVVHWINLKPEGTPMVVGTLFNIVQVYEGLREDALDSLMLLSNRSQRTGDEVLYAALLDQEIERMEQLFTHFVQSSQGNNGDSEEQEKAYGHLKKLTEILVNVSTTYIAHKRHPALPVKLDRILSTLLSLLSLPSLIISSLSLIFWNAAIRGHDSLFGSPAMQALLPALFMRLLSGMAMERKAERRQPWNRMDFDLEADFEELFLATTNRQQSLLEALAGRYDGTMEFLRSAVGSFVGEASEALRDARKVQPKMLTQWTALCEATESICRGGQASSKKKSQNSEDQQPPLEDMSSLNALLDGFLAGIVDPATSHPEVIGAWLYAVRGLSIRLGPKLTNPGLIPGMLHLIVSYKSITGSSEAECVIKGRVSNLMLRLAGVAPLLFLAPDNQALLGTIWSQLGPKQILQQRFLTELILVVSGSEQEAQRVDLIDRVTRPHLEAVESFMIFLRCHPMQESSGALCLAQTGRLSEDSADFRRTLSNLLALTFIVVNRLSLQPEMPPSLKDYLRGTVVPRLVNDLLALLASVLEMSKAEAWAPEHRKVWHELFVRRQNDVTNVLAAFDPSSEESNNNASATSGSTDMMNTLRGWFSTIQVSVMVSLGILTKLPGFYQHLGSLSRLYLAKFDPASASIWQVSWVWKHLLHPLLVNASSDSLAADPSFNRDLDRILAATTSRLIQDWTCLGQATSATNNVGGTTVEEEVEREAELVMATQCLINMLYDVMYPVGERDKKVEPCLDLANPSALPKFPVVSKTAIWFSTANLERQETILRIFLSSLHWRHSVGFNKIFLLLLRWLPAFAMNQRLHPILFGAAQDSLLPAALTILGRPDLSDCHAAANQLFVELYKWSVLLNCNDPFQHLLASLQPPINTGLLHTALTDPARTSSKLHREAGRSCLKAWQAALAQQASGRAFVVPRLPEKLVLMKRLLKVEQPEDEVTAEDIDSLFNV